MSNSSSQLIDASPVKEFFVSMLTRDIGLDEAILDLLDNCVDGISRRSRALDSDKPYKGFWAKISFDGKHFSISDNCGGIPKKLYSYAFRMGRSKERSLELDKGTVGVFGIGMKRAVFKIGESCTISTQNGSDRNVFTITPEWLKDDASKNSWSIPYKKMAKKMDRDGTTIEVKNLRDGVAKRFTDEIDAFQGELETKIATHYAYILEKGFRVTINGVEVVSRPVKLFFDPGEHSKRFGLQPYIFQGTIEGVEVFLAVGFTRNIPDQTELDEELAGKKKNSSKIGGWTVLCNDRAVLSNDHTEQTGWGETGVPRYHTQFIAISGIVSFKSDDASKLPTTTTKRGIDGASTLYLKVKNKMREGTRIFIDFTNGWKGRSAEVAEYFEKAGQPIALSQIAERAKALSFSTTSGSVVGKQYKPMLPAPKRLPTDTQRISFVKTVKEIRRVAEYLFDDADVKPSKVGEECFDMIMKDSK